MAEIRINTTMKFDPGDFEEVVRLCEANDAAAMTRPGVLEHSSWYSDARDAVHIREHYAGDDALINHVRQMDGELVSKLIALATMDGFDVIGERTAKNEELLSGFGAPLTYYGRAAVQ